MKSVLTWDVIHNGLWAAEPVTEQLPGLCESLCLILRKKSEETILMTDKYLTALKYNDVVVEGNDTIDKELSHQCKYLNLNP